MNRTLRSSKSKTKHGTTTDSPKEQWIEEQNRNPDVIDTKLSESLGKKHLIPARQAKQYGTGTYPWQRLSVRLLTSKGLGLTSSASSYSLPRKDGYN